MIPYLKKVADKIISKKFIALIIASGMLWFGKLDSQNYVFIIGICLAANGAEKIFIKK